MKTETGTVSVKFDSKPEGITRAVSYSQLETQDDCLNMLQTPEGLKSLIAAANYGFNLKARSAVRQAILETEGGPDKAIDKMVKDLIKARQVVGKPITEGAAREMVLKFM